MSRDTGLDSGGCWLPRQPSDAKRQCAFWGTGGALRRFRKPHSESDESTPLEIYDWSLLTLIGSHAIPTAGAKTPEKSAGTESRTTPNSLVCNVAVMFRRARVVMAIPLAPVVCDSG
jgi:hypothetical protein